VYKKLEQCQRINFFKFIINPTSFGQSVENMFYVSFMIRDAKIAFEVVDDEPIICERSVVHRIVLVLSSLFQLRANLQNNKTMLLVKSQNGN
jgi:hypothetical protein